MADLPPSIANAAFFSQVIANILQLIGENVCERLPRFTQIMARYSKFMESQLEAQADLNREQRNQMQYHLQHKFNICYDNQIKKYLNSVLGNQINRLFALIRMIKYQLVAENLIEKKLEEEIQPETMTGR